MPDRAGAVLGEGRRRGGRVRTRGRARPMTVNVPGRPMTADLVGHGGADAHAGADAAQGEKLRAPGRERGPSPRQGDRLRPLSRRQVEDRFEDLGDLYEETSGGATRAGTRSRAEFLRRLAGEVRRPGFTLLIAENTTLTAFAHGFPVRGADPWWQGCDTRLPRTVRGLAVTGGLFAVSGIVVPPGCAPTTRTGTGTSPGACNAGCSPITRRPSASAPAARRRHRDAGRVPGLGLAGRRSGSA
ncbi:hypothetical protein ACRAWF_31035 [Streptomyces sp. L7]